MIRVGRNLLDIRRAAAKKLDISLWTDVKKKKPFKVQRTRDQKPQRYGVVDRYRFYTKSRVPKSFLFFEINVGKRRIRHRATLKLNL